MRSVLLLSVPAVASAAACIHFHTDSMEHHHSHSTGYTHFDSTDHPQSISTESLVIETPSSSLTLSNSLSIAISSTLVKKPVQTITTVRTSSSSGLTTVSSSAPSPILTTSSQLEVVSTTSTALCGNPSASIVVQSAEVMVAAYIMNPDLMPSGSSLCSGYYGVSEDDKVTWSTNMNIEDDENGSEYKGYSNIAIPGGNTGIGSTLGEITSIPTEWEWSMSNTSAWMGDYIFDFVFSPTKGDWSSSSAIELMLYLDYSDDLGFIGQSSGVVSTVSLFGVDGWSIYYGQGTGNVWMTASLVAPKEARYAGYFSGDIMDWINALKDVANLEDTMYCSAANAGMEAFHGDITVQHITSLKIMTTENEN